MKIFQTKHRFFWAKTVLLAFLIGPLSFGFSACQGYTGKSIHAQNSTEVSRSTQWEYMALDISELRESQRPIVEIVEEKLNELGKERWEFASYVDGAIIMKRPLQ